MDTAQYKDYLEAIATPMDFGAIRRTLEAGGYASPAPFRADVRLVFDNARQYNKAGSDVHVMANTLQVRGRRRREGVGSEGVWAEGVGVRPGGVGDVA